MKFLISLLAGMLTGASLLVAGLIFNPFAGQQSLSPLTVTEAQTITLAFSTVATENIILTNNGETRVDPHPEKVPQLWEAPIRRSSAIATVLRTASNQVAGIGVKFSSQSEKTRLLGGEAIVDSVWHVYLPGRGSLFVEQYENHWRFFREVMVSAYRSSANTWRGIWLGDITAGPGALNTAKVTGGSGEFSGNEMIAVESSSVQAWSADTGPIAASGRLVIELPRPDRPEDE